MSTTIRLPSHGTVARGGYLAGALVDVALLVVVNVSPGWRAAPFLTGAARDVVVVVNVSLAVALVVNLLSLLFAGPVLIRAGEVVSTTAGLAAVLKLLMVFPFRFDDSAADWTTVVRSGLIAVVVLVSIAVVVQLARLVPAVRTRERGRQRDQGPA